MEFLFLGDKLKKKYPQKYLKFHRTSTPQNRIYLLNAKHKTIKLLDENGGDNVCDLILEASFLDIPPKT